MGIREQLNQNPKIATGITIGIIVAVLIVIIIQAVGGDSDSGDTKARQAYFTVDDGDTTFNDDPAKLAPFDHNGQTAVQAHMFTCDDGKTRFMGYLSKLNDRALKQAQAAPKDDKGQIADGEVLAEFRSAAARLVRLPKSKSPTGKWVAANSAEGRQIMNVTCPDGGRAMEVYKE